MEEKDKIALIGIIALIVSAINFLSTGWNWITTIEFGTICLVVSYLINKAQEKVK